MDREIMTQHEPSESVEQDQFLTFTLARQSYALDVLDVREIRSWSDPTPLPHSAPEVLGAMNLRGAIIPVIDLRIQLGVSQPNYDSTTGVVVVQGLVNERQRQMGLVVDRVLNVCRLDSLVDDAVDRDIAEVASRFIVGLARFEDELIIRLDLDAIMSASLEVDLADAEIDG